MLFAVFIEVISSFLTSIHFSKISPYTICISIVRQNKITPIIFKEIVTLDGRGYVDANENCLTNAKGIFVAGDCRTKNIRQVITAAGDGAVAALAACDYVDSIL